MQHDNPQIHAIRTTRAAKKGVKTLPKTASLEELIAAFNALVFTRYGNDADVPTNKAHLDASTKKEVEKAEHADA